jgi:hypothetical protein
MHIDQRITDLEKRLDDLLERLYAKEAISRPAPPPKEYVTAKASNVTLKTHSSIPGANLGANVLFDFPCVCGKSHHVEVRGIRDLFYNSVREHTYFCEEANETVKVIVRIPRNPDKVLLEEAVEDLAS